MASPTTEAASSATEHIARAVGAAAGTWVADGIPSGAEGILAEVEVRQSHLGPASDLARFTRDRRFWGRHGAVVTLTADEVIDAHPDLASVTVIARRPHEGDLLARAALRDGPRAGRRALCGLGGLLVHADGTVDVVPALAMVAARLRFRRAA
jgi:hypothetical protein